MGRFGVRVGLEPIKPGGSHPGLVVLHFYPFGMWLGADTSSIPSLLSACIMTRGEEETSTSQAGSKRGLPEGCVLQAASSHP